MFTSIVAELLEPFPAVALTSAWLGHVTLLLVMFPTNAPLPVTLAVIAPLAASVVSCVIVLPITEPVILPVVPLPVNRFIAFDVEPSQPLRYCSVLFSTRYVNWLLEFWS